MICISIAESSLHAVQNVLSDCKSSADIVEIRLDSLSRQVSSAALSAFVDQSPVPLIFTCRKHDEGGLFKGDEVDRLACLHNAVDSGTFLVDVELTTDQPARDRLIRYAGSRGCRVIVSWHDFKGTPPEKQLEDILAAQKNAGADIAKIVTMAREPSDIPRLFSLYYSAARLGIPLVAFCMGEVGKISRVACLAMGAYLSFASPESGLETAPGQIPVGQFRKILDMVM